MGEDIGNPQEWEIPIFSGQLSCDSSGPTRPPRGVTGGIEARLSKFDRALRRGPPVTPFPRNVALRDFTAKEFCRTFDDRPAGGGAFSEAVSSRQMAMRLRDE